MRRIRIGKDIEIRWKVFTNGEAVSLHDRNLKLVIHHSMLPEQDLPFTIDDDEDNVLVAYVRGRDQRMTGVYRLTLWENYGINGQTVLDYCSAFELVGTTCEEDGGSVGLDSEVVEITANLIIGVPGLDGLTAYELFKKYHPDSKLTEEQYAEAPIEEAMAANEAAKAANDTNDKVTEAERLRVQAEGERAKAESQRVEAEKSRSDAEQEREQSETSRVESENQRKNAEDIRNSNETSRVNAEVARARNEESRVSAESARVSAETKRSTQEKSRQDAEAIRVSNEKGRVSAEEQRVIAESERASAEEEREKSVEEALTDMSTAIGNAEKATSSANSAAQTANTSAQSANNAATAANKAANRADSLADNPPKIVDVDGTNYWAFWDEATQQYVTSSYRADGSPLYASFYIDPETMDLFAVYPDGYGSGPTFSLNNGDLSVTINE